MENFDEKEMDKLIHLCRIACSKEEKEKLKKSLDKILEYVKQLDEVDTTGLEPFYGVSELLANVMREDVACNTLSRETFLSNAPAHVGGMIRVPTVIKFSNH